MPRNQESRLAEVEWGVAQEQAILSRWLRVSPRMLLADRVIKGRDTSDFDFIVFDRNHLPMAYVEVKARRIPFNQFGDAVAPIRKHEYAVKLAHRHKIPMLMIVAHSCGTLVEVDLAEPPCERRDIKRRDRDKSVPHGIWKHDQVRKVWEDDVQATP